MGRVYAGQSAQDRSATRRRQLIDAAIAQIGSHGLANTTVRGVCDEAGLSTRFFYEAFAGLDALAVAAYDASVEHAFTTIYQATLTAGPDREVRARASIAAIVDYITAHPASSRLVFVEALGTGALAPKRRETMHQLASAITSLARMTYAVDEDEPMVKLTATLVAGGVTELMIGWLDGSLDMPRDRLIDDCARLIVAIGDTADALDPRSSAGPGR